MPGLDVAFLVIVTTSVRLSLSADTAVLICDSALLCAFKPELSVTHLLALAHLASQSGPAWHVIWVGFDNPSSGRSPLAQLQAPKRANAKSKLGRTYPTAIPPTQAFSARAAKLSVTKPDSALRSSATRRCTGRVAPDRPAIPSASSS